MSELILHHLTGSPNSTRVRIALNYKGLPFELRELQLNGTPEERDSLRAISRQPFTPVLQHGETTIFDSLGIVRYLEANFPDTPPLFHTDYATMREIEDWELKTRTLLSEPVGMVFGEATRPAPDPEVLMRANELFHVRTQEFEDRLKEHEWLVGDRMTSADVANAPYVFLGIFEGSADDGPITRTFARHFRLGSGRDATRDWATRVMSHAGMPQTA